LACGPRLICARATSERTRDVTVPDGYNAAMRRIAVIGPVASGKTILARFLGSRMAIPVVDLDDVYFSAARPLTDDEWSEFHRSLLEPERWIIAGDYRAVAGERFAAADTIVWLDLPRLVCLWRALRRASPASKADCLRWIWRYPTRGREQTIALLREHAASAEVVHLRSVRDVRAFMMRIS